MSTHETSSSPQPEQPWDGLHGLRLTGIGQVEPYTEEQADEAARWAGLSPRLPGETWDVWSQRLANEARDKDMSKMSFSELEDLRVQAIAAADYTTLQALEVEARGRDGWDDTDARYYYFANNCVEKIQEVMTHYG